MQWKIASFAALVLLTITLVSFGLSLYSRPYDLYMRATKSERPFPGASHVDLEDLNEAERDWVISYLEASHTIGSFIKVSDEWCPIQLWADSVYEDHGSLVNARYLNDYYQVEFWPKESLNPSALENNTHMILTTLTIILWVIFILHVFRAEERR